ncbi:PREDICTED: lysophosphatidic acid receptor 1-like [Priapulus caudatus]|uniref:Lysophosphatidic acid receptor 1-like n=1 Tax=Priapulus caudatus TaxID=37621 RepID=A0ABM1F1K3_PRICU|nr:PREDICTED: lysophosphatidic acid receptor 1-like [Priapulus caudatus]
MATANGSLCNISGSVSENGSWIGCMESDVEQGTVKAIQASIAYLLIPLNLISILANLLVILAPDQPCIFDTVSTKISVIFNVMVICTCGVAMVFIYAYIMMISKHHQRQIHQEPSSSGSQEAGATGKSFFAELVKHLKLAKMFDIVIGAFVACWTPVLFLMLLSVADFYHDTLGVATGFGYMMADSNSFMNFFIYASKSSQFRAAFRAVLLSRGH